MRIIILVLVVLILAACASPHSKIMVGPSRPAISPEAVRIYTKPPEGYEEIAIVSSNASRNTNKSAQSQQEYLIRAFKNLAASVGANGILLTVGSLDSETVNSGGVYTGGILFTSHTTIHDGKAMAIWVPDQSGSGTSPQTEEKPLTKSEVVQSCIDECRKTKGLSAAACWDECAGM